MTEEIRILIVDDHAIVREGQRALIETEPANSSPNMIHNLQQQWCRQRCQKVFRKRSLP